MLTLNNLTPCDGARKDKNRVGRGPGSGNGKTSGKGHKGARARAGYSAKPGFEGGQMPLHRRLPKRGFTNIFKQEIVLITLDQLNSFDEGAVIDMDALIESGFVKQSCSAKILANGDITKSITVRNVKTSQGAKTKIVAAGGVVED